MKKVFCVFLAVILCFGTLSACSKPNTQTNTTTAAATTADITSEPLTEATTTAFKKLTDAQIAKLSLSKFKDYLNSIDYSGVDDEEIFSQEAELTAKQFLNYLMSKDVKSISALIGADYYNAKGKLVSNKAYKFFGEIDVKSYKISDIYSDSYTFSCNVKLTISKSSNKLFPVGSSTWDLEIGYSRDSPPLAVQLFKRVNKTITTGNFGAAVYFCRNFSDTFYCFKTMTDFNNLVPNVKDKDTYTAFCYDLIALTDFLDDSPLKRKTVEARVKAAFGITTVDFRKSGDYNKTDDTILAGGSCMTWYYCSLSSESFDSGTKLYTIIIDYYSDAAFILKAKTMKYVVRENTDESLSLLSTRLLFDTGAELAGGFG